MQNGRKGRAVGPVTIPPSWDGKIGLAALFLIGYFLLAIYVIKFGGLSNNQKDLALVVLAATGPQLTQIFTALFRTTAADERQAALRSSDLQAAIQAPPAIVETGGIEDDVRTGARAGAREGVTEGLGGVGTVEPTDRDRPPPSQGDD